MLRFYRFKSFQAHPKLSHAVTQKSDIYPYNFSLALHTGEDREKILQNRELLKESLASKQTLHFILADQTHSNHIEIIDKVETRGWSNSHDAIRSCDALITDLPNVMLAVLTADCVPVLLYDREKEVVAAVHAGWRGTEAKIVEKTIQKMKDYFKSQSEDIIAGIGPSIGSCCYEVGSDVAKHFSDTPHALRKKGNRYMLDLPFVNYQQLLKSGLPDSNIELSHICTACNTDNYFSYRKEHACSGRFMSIIGLCR